jgi:hypothetical protein
MDYLDQKLEHEARILEGKRQAPTRRPKAHERRFAKAQARGYRFRPLKADNDGNAAIGAIVSGMLVIVIGALLSPMVTSSTAEAQNDANLTANAKTIAKNTPVFYWLIVFMGAAAAVFVVWRMKI